MGEIAKFMLMISISHLNIDFRGGLATTPPKNNPTPPDAMDLLPDAGSCRIGGPLAEIPTSSRRGCPEQGERAPAERGEARARAALPLAIGAEGDIFDLSGGVGEALDKLQRPVSEVFPANKIFTRCGRCGKGIERFKGYKHYPVGDRKTYCWQCHQAMGLPLREVIS